MQRAPSRRRCIYILSMTISPRFEVPQNTERSALPQKYESHLDRVIYEASFDVKHFLSRPRA